MRDEAELVERVDGLGIGVVSAQRLVDITLRFDDHFALRVRRQRLGLLHEVRPAVLRGGAGIPIDLQRLARGEHRPSALADDRDAGQHARLHHVRDGRRTLDDERVEDARQLLDLLDIEALGLAADRGAFRDARVLHPRELHIEREQRLAADERGVVDAREALADELVFFAVLEFERSDVRHRQRGGGRRQRSITRRSSACGVDDPALGGGEVGSGHAPLLRGGGDEHRARTGARVAQLIPSPGDRHRAPCDLRAVYGAIDLSLLDRDIRPLRIELLGEDHAEARLDALPDLRVLRDEGDPAVWCDAHERSGRERPRRRTRLRLPDPRHTHGQAEHQPARSTARHFDEAATAQIGEHPGGDIRASAEHHAIELLAVHHAFSLPAWPLPA